MKTSSDEVGQPHLVFVYGTLKRGHHNHACLGHTPKLIGTAALVGAYEMISLGGFPAILPSKAGDLTPVSGEVYQVSTATLLGPLDSLEGYFPDNEEQSFYHRRKVQAKVMGKALDCWAYILNETEIRDYDYPSIPSACW